MVHATVRGKTFRAADTDEMSDPTLLLGDDVDLRSRFDGISFGHNLTEKTLKESGTNCSCKCWI
jgi:hypothetical protein